MTEYFTPVDIANRALQHCGAERINPLLGFAEVSRNAREASFAYGKLRRAELQSNAWTFATRRTALRAIDTTTMLLTPTLWGASTTFFRGSIVSDGSGNYWISNSPNNLGQDPQNSLTWDPYFGPLTVSKFSAGTAYYAGELVYTAAGDGTNRVYLSLLNSNTDTPATATPWSATGVYMKNQVVTYLSVAYMSLIDLNTNKVPSVAPALFNIATVYASGAQVGGSDGVIYTSLSNGNVGFDPVSDSGVHWTNTGVLNPWTTVFVGGKGSLQWLQIGGAEFPNGATLSSMNFTYPLGVGPFSQSSTRNIFKLPAGYLREAAQYPKATTIPLGAPSGVTYNDWNFENGYLITADGGPIPFRFIADIVDVRLMTDMFCEGLAARIGMEISETITQSGSKLGTIAKVYQEWIDQAKTRNAIEAGYDDPPDDDYLTVRY